MELLKEIRRYTAYLPCAVCSVVLANCDLRLLSDEPGLATIEAVCLHCESDFLFQVQYVENFPRPPRIEPIPDPNAPVIESDEILDVHSILKDFSGSLTELIKKR